MFFLISLPLCSVTELWLKYGFGFMFITVESYKVIDLCSDAMFLVFSV